MKRRWHQHCAQAKRSKGRSHFGNAILKYGKEAFSHEVLQTCETLEEANAAEARWVDRFQTRDPQYGFNLAPGGQHVPHPVRNVWDDPAKRAMMSDSIKETWKDPAYRKSVSSGLKELWQDPAHRERMSAASKAVFDRPGVREKVGAAARGREFSEETRRKIVANLTGRTHVTSPETKAKLSAALKRHFAEAR